MNYTALKYANSGLIGLAFMGLSILSGLTIYMPAYATIAIEWMGKQITLQKVPDPNDVSFCLVKAILAIIAMVYIGNLFNRGNYTNIVLICTLIGFVVFLPPFLFYLDWEKMHYRSDGQLAMAIIFKPIVSCWVYPLLGFLHYAIVGTHRGEN
ncbi:hypothetical protein [Lewinella sp. IMCC34183]|uniref:hypothetical protein n=1 Tax=Lewinella sp. IMCC34183 TaxID=2248762 RepID=UPI0013009ABD|nr:hypothetical protein [Lewinella sp. IMCC34183]